LFLLLLIVPNSVHAQAWNGIIDPSRAMDWSQAGTTIVEPTVQCGATIAPMGTLASPVAPTAISNAIAACTPGQYVSLGAGNFYLSSGWGWWDGVSNWKHNVVVRGQGANSTLIYFVGSSVGVGNSNSAVAIEGGGLSSISEQNVCNWIANYSKGTTTIQLANCGSTTPAVGSVSNLAVGTLLVLDQVDLTADNGTAWNCAVNYTCANSGTGGIIRTSGTCTVGGPSPCARSQAQGVVVTSITTTGGSCTSSSPCVGITPGLYMPTWTGTQLPQAWFGMRSIVGDAIENMSIDATNAVGLGQIIEIENCYGCWVSGVRTIASPRDHIIMNYVWHSVVKDNYFYKSLTAGAGSYSVEMDYTWDSLVQNNICQQVTDSCPGMDSATEGNVSAYNFSINNIFTLSVGWEQASFYHHDSGDALNLAEGNIGTGSNADAIHGTHLFDTDFRNYYVGQQAAGCNGFECTSQATPVILSAGARYFNLVGNVLGQPGFHTAYQCVATSTASCGANAYVDIYNLGYTGNGGQADGLTPRTGFCNNVACATPGNFDGLVGPYLMRWGNYDVVNAAVQWNSAEVPSTLASYSNPVPTSHALPPSFYLSSKPAWWGTTAWPPIGPDVTTGNIGNCTTGTNVTYAIRPLATATTHCGGGSFTPSVVGGHANANPAMNCYLNAMNGRPDGGGSALGFNASACYGQGGSATLPQPPTSVSATIGN
jgi:hypothetical protein